MLKVSFRTVSLEKLYPLTISRGTSGTTENLFVFVTDGTHTGVGELAPAAATAPDWDAVRGEREISEYAADGIAPSPYQAYDDMKARGVCPPASAALEMALWDLLARQASLPLYRLLGLPRKSVPTSVTIGLNPPEVTLERVTHILSLTQAKCLKIKLGSPEGLDHDREHFLAAAASAKPFGAVLRVDANGGWTVAKAKQMIPWLAEHGVEYVEQPLPLGMEDGYPEIFEGRALPVFADESIKFAPDVVKMADRVDGINLKLMKCGGVVEALRIVATARAHGLKTMIGCMSESSVGIAPGAAIGALFDYIDLDTHTNLAPDPAIGLAWENGVVLPPNAPGHGVTLKEA
ncbi:MAG: dipeptide epimerase [Fimbriimonas sp.]